MNDIEIALEDLDTLVEIARQHTGIASWLGLVQSALIMKEALEKQLNGGWIPVSERLPTIRECQENDCRFMVTDGNRRYQVWFDYVEGYFDKCECNGLGLKKDKCVIAWQPLPPAYKEAENE